ncbi:MAG TPA: ABC transporter permease [Actinomycetota bacterium]|nr:ABC transporter permease [Actinomycetota bacterium]
MATATAAARRRGVRRIRAPRFALALPAWAWFAFFFAIPVLTIVYYSFGYKPGIFDQIATDRLSFERYGEILQPTFFRVFSQTLQISVIGTLLCFAIGFPFAYWLAVRVSPRWRGLLLGLCIVPFWTNFLIRTIGWLILLSPSGPASGVLQDVGLRSEPLHLLQTRFAVQLGVVYNYLPLMIFPLFVALDRLDPALREASKDLGASRWKTFRQVTLPLATPGIIAGLLLVFIPLTGDYITPSVLGGAKGNMVGNLVASQFLVAQNWALGSAAAVALVVMILVTVGAFAAVGLALRALVARRRRVEIPALSADGGTIAEPA